MKQEQLENLKKWLGEYVADFYCDDEYINANIRLKECHSHRTREEMNYLTSRLSLDTNKKLIAESTALLHDIGRFEQFKKYQTYSDHRSVNHSELALEILHQTQILDRFDKTEKKFIEKAIEYHNLKELPEGLNGDLLLYSKLIRDADKLDIFFVATECYKQLRMNPESVMLEIEFPDTPEYTPSVLEDLLAGEKVNYKMLNTFNDMKLLQLGWVYDINFVAALERIKKRGFLDMVLDFLPQTEDIDKVRKKIFEYVDERIQNQS